MYAGEPVVIKELLELTWGGYWGMRSLGGKSMVDPWKVRAVSGL